MHSIDPLHSRPILRRARSLAALVGAALVALPGGVQAQSAEAILQAASERHEALAGFCADFHQTVQNDILGQTTRSRGELCQLRPDRFEMRFSDPQGDRVVADGQYLWIYLPSADPGQVFQSSSAEAGGRFDLHREFLTEPGRRYAARLEGEEQVNGRSAHVLALEPRVESPFLRARVWVDASDALIRKVEITEDEGFVRIVELSGMELNPSISPERFQFEPPEGVQVIRR
jgi:outer membrane lipoprotein carrier protein